MLLHDARRAARLDASGDLVTLEDQDRALWDGALDQRGRLAPGGGAAARAARVRTRSRPPSPRATRPRPPPIRPDWAQIAGLYARLAAFLPTPVVELNHAVAVGMARGPWLAWSWSRRWRRRASWPGYHLLPATRADFLRRLGRMPEAAIAYREALELTSTDAERRYLSPPAGGGQRACLRGIPFKTSI